MAITFLDLIEKVLKDSDKPLKTRQIWQIAIEKGYDKELPPPSGGQRLTPESSIGTSLHRELKKENTKFLKTVNGFFWLKEKQTSEAQLDKLEEASEKEYDKSIDLPKFEKELHAPLARYLYDSNDMYSKTINANAVRSKSGEMKWGTPDMVGVSFREYDPTLQTLRQHMGLSNIELCAFEIKLKLNTSNLTEYFFQAVSNSSWANEAWLVAFDIQEDDSFKQELERLNKAFGVGILQLDVHNPEESQVIYPATKRTNLDWNTMDKLIRNQEFKDFISHISDVASSKDKFKERLEENVKLGKFDNPHK